MALDPKITQAAAQSLLTALETALNAGTNASIEGIDNDAATPTNAEDSQGISDTLFQLSCATSIFTTKTDGAPGAVGTFAAITADASANDTGTLTYFRIRIDPASTDVFQGTAGTSTCDMIVNTTAITAGSTVDDTGSNTITVPEYT